jgi:hypothetical protein
LLSLLRGAARDVADPEPWLETATLIEAMHARVFSAALHQDVVTIPAPRGCECRVDNGASMAHASKFGMRDHIFEKAVPPSGSQEIWRRDEHTGCRDLCVHSRYEHCDAVVGQYLQPNLLGSLDRLGTGAHFRDPKEFEQRSKVGRLSKPGIGHGNTELWITGQSSLSRASPRCDGLDLDQEIRAIEF